MTHIKSAVLVLIMMMLFSLIFFYASMMSTVSRARDDTQRVLDSFCIEKAVVIYDSIKNGNKQMVSGTYTTEFMAKIADELGLSRTGNTGFHRSGSDIIFQYTNPLTANLKNDTLSLTMDFEIVMPINFAGQKVTDMRVPLKVESIYVLK